MHIRINLFLPGAHLVTGVGTPVTSESNTKLSGSTDVTSGAYGTTVVDSTRNPYTVDGGPETW